MENSVENTQNKTNIFDILKTTQEEISLIKLKNKEAILNFFNNNYILISNMAKKYLRFSRYIFGFCSVCIDDLINQFYVDLPYFNFDNIKLFYKSVFNGSFRKCTCGGFLSPNSSFCLGSRIFSIDSFFDSEEENKNSAYLLDKFVNSPDVYDVLFNSLDFDRDKKDEKILQFLEKTFNSNKKQLNYMFCKIFTNLDKNNITGGEYDFFKQCKFEISKKKK